MADPSSLPNMLQISQFPIISGLIILLGLVAVWIIISLPIYISAKIMTRGRATFLSAMGAALFGPVVYGITGLVVALTLGFLVGVMAIPIALFFGFIAWVVVFKAVFSSNWLGAFAISVLAMIIFLVVFVVILLMMTTIFGLTIPREINPVPTVPF